MAKGRFTGRITQVEGGEEHTFTFTRFSLAIDILGIDPDSEEAMDYVRVRDKLKPEQRDAVKRKFHENVKPEGNMCPKCHHVDSILDFRKLQFAENRIKDLQQLNIRGLITKYETFYIPNLFKEEEQKTKESEKRMTPACTTG